MTGDGEAAALYVINPDKKSYAQKKGGGEVQVKSQKKQRAAGSLFF